MKPFREFIFEDVEDGEVNGKPYDFYDRDAVTATINGSMIAFAVQGSRRMAVVKNGKVIHNGIVKLARNHNAVTHGGLTRSCRNDVKGWPSNFERGFRLFPSVKVIGSREPLTIDDFEKMTSVANARIAADIKLLVDAYNMVCAKLDVPKVNSTWTVVDWNDHHKSIKKYI